MKFHISSILLVASLAILIGCDGAAKKENVAQRQVQQVQSVNKVVDYGNGVYYFPFLQSDFANELSAFIGQHPELELVAMTGNGNDLYGANLGYFTYFRKK
jgi:hypothetical protein